MKNEMVEIPDISAILFTIEDPLNGFNKEGYADTFQNVYEKSRLVLATAEEEYIKAEDKPSCLDEVAGLLTRQVEQHLADCKKARDRELKLLDLNLALAAYVIPVILEYHGTVSHPLADAILKKWNITFPSANVKKATNQDINDGFKKKLCYITTAVCQTLGKEDDCYELNLLREFRDHYLAFQTGGEKLIEEYYDIAPTILHAIDQSENPSIIYGRVWDNYLKPCISHIEVGNKEECCTLYTKMVNDLRKEFLSTRL